MLLSLYINPGIVITGNPLPVTPSHPTLSITPPTLPPTLHHPSTLGFLILFDALLSSSHPTLSPLPPYYSPPPTRLSDSSRRSAIVGISPHPPTLPLTLSPSHPPIPPYHPPPPTRFSDSSRRPAIVGISRRQWVVCGYPGHRISPTR